MNRVSYNILTKAKLAFISVSAFVGMIFFASCNDLPTDVGIPTDTLEFFAISSVEDPSILLRSDNFSPEFPVVFGSGSALLGNTELTSSTVFLGFETPPDTLNNLQTTDLINPRLVLNFDRYAYGDSLSNFAFDIIRTMYELPEIAKWEWAYDGYQWPQSSKYDLSNTIATYSGILPLGDTNTLEIPIPAELVKEYLDITAERGDTFAFPQGQYPFGMAIVSSPQNTQFRRLFTSISTDNTLNPKVRFSYQGVDSIVEVVMDAAITGQLLKPIDDPEQGDIIIGSGVRRRSQLYFDVSSLPQDANVISSALWLYSKPERNQFGNISPDSIVVVDSLRNASDSLITNNTYVGVLNSSGELYFPTISAFMAGWNYADRSDTLTLMPLRPVSRLDRLVFHSPSSTEITKRPKLVVIYQKQPEI